MRLRVAGLALLAAALLTSSIAHAADGWFSIRGRPEFADVRAQLQVVVDEHGRRGTNRFCVVGETAGRFEQAWVYWPQDGKLILWRPDRDNPHAIAGSKRYLDLERDVVQGDDVAGSSYKLTRATAREKIRACRRYGATYTIERSAEGAAHG